MEELVMTDATPEISFHATLRLVGKTATGIEVPRELLERLGAGKKPASASRSTATPIAARSLRAVSASSSA
jgi:hypothetical protein